MMDVNKFLTDVSRWAHGQTDIEAIALVGSHARGVARPTSDIDLIIICKDLQLLLCDQAWREGFGEIRSCGLEDWDLVQSIRTFYENGIEAEFGVTSDLWARIPADPGTREVVANGMKILYDPEGTLSRLNQAVYG